MHGDVLLDGGGQFRDAAKHTIAQAFGRKVTEEALDHIEPGRRGPGGMRMEPRVLVASHSSTFARHREVLDPLGFQATRLPNALHRGVDHAGHRRQRPGAPPGPRPLRRGLRGQAHDLSGVHLALAPAVYRSRQRPT